MMRIDQATHDVSSHVHAKPAPRRAIAVPLSRTRPPLEIWASLAWAALLAAVAVAALAMLPARRAAAADAPAASAKEQQLLAVLTGDADEATKAITCKQLAIVGSSHSVDALEALLPNERLASWARIALEAIPGPEASAALRRSTAILRGRELIGVINTLGVRQDDAAVPLLLTRLSGGDDEIAAAAAAALGRIGGAAAVAGLEARLISTNEKCRDAAAEACVVAGESLLAEGKAGEAAALAAAVRQAEVSEQRKAEALRLAILAGGADGLALLTESFWEPSRRLFAMAVTTARSLPRGDAGLAADQAVVDGIEGLLAGKGPDARAGVLLDVLAQRSSKQAVPLVLRLVAEAPQPVRVAAIEAAGRLGDVSVLEPLLAAVADSDAEVAAAARGGLISLSGDEIDAALIERLQSESPAVLAAVVEAIGARRLDAGNELLPLADHGEEPVRIAVLRSLGSVGDLDAMEVIIARVRSPGSSAEAEAAKLALLEAAVRMPDREGCAERIAAALAKADEAAEADIVLLETLAAVGGPAALATINKAASSGVRSLEDASTRLLGTWMTADAAPVLLELATAREGAFRGRALRGYLRIARQFTMPDDQRAAMCRAALAVASNDDERKLVVEILPRNPSQSMLDVAREAETMPGVAEAAKAAATAITAALAKKAG